MIGWNSSNFNPHLPCGRWQYKARHGYAKTEISIHTFLAEGDVLSRFRWILSSQFQSTPSLRKVTYDRVTDADGTVNFNPHLPCGRWRWWTGNQNLCVYFNPHLPCGRWRRSGTRSRRWRSFQSTPSLRKVTITSWFQNDHECISIHTFLAEGDLPWTQVEKRLGISIHTFLAEGDRKNIYN